MSYFKIHYIEGYIQNCFIVEYKDKILLLDGLSKPDYPIIKHFITKVLGKELSCLKLSIITHPHADHTGAAKLFQKNDNVPIFANKNINDWYKGISGTIQQIIDIKLAHFVANKQQKQTKNLYLPKKIIPNFVHDKTGKLPCFDDWISIETPGHTACDLCFYHKKSGILYVGDVVLEMNGKLVLPFPTIFPEKMKISLQKLAVLDIKKLIPAHGKPMLSSNISELLFTLSEKTQAPLKKQFKKIRFLVQINKASRLS